MDCGGVEPSPPQEDATLGQHFLITDTTGALLSQDTSDTPYTPPPQKSQKLKSKTTPKSQEAGKTLSASGRLVRGTGDIPCENCGRMFSSHSNKERHKREHCHKFQPLSRRQEHGYWREQEQQEQVEHSCPMEGCGEVFAKSVHVKRHLASTHGVSNPLQWMEEQGAEVRAAMAGLVDLDDEDRVEDLDAEDRVPPLRIKLPSPPLVIAESVSNYIQCATEMNIIKLLGTNHPSH